MQYSPKIISAGETSARNLLHKDTAIRRRVCARVILDAFFFFFNQDMKHVFPPCVINASGKMQARKVSRRDAYSIEFYFLI